MDEPVAMMLARERERQTRMCVLRRTSLARQRALRAAVREARQTGEQLLAEEYEADRRTLLRGLWWLRQEERDLAERLAFLREQLAGGRVARWEESPLLDVAGGDT